MKYYGLIIPTVFPTGVFIQDIKQTVKSDESEGVNTITITLTNQQKAYFNVKNGKQGSSVEATTQMEQHAREYITAELIKQKTELEKAIENGKIAINNSVEQAKKAVEQKAIETTLEINEIIYSFVEEVKNDINKQLSVASQGIKDLINTKITEVMSTTNTNFINLLKNGYIQWPGMPRPDTLFDFQGYRWAEVNYNGCFFRAKGQGAYSFNNGEQGDAIRNIMGDFSGLEIFNTTSLKEFNGAFSLENLKPPCADGSYSGSGSGKIKFDASKVVPVSNENRPRNRTIIIWKLEKI